MITVLTIDREYGSGAVTIAQKVAARLGWKLWDQALTDAIARHMQCDKLHVERHEERKDPLYYRMFKAFLRGSYEGSQRAPSMGIADAETIRQVSEKMVRAAAQEGNAVIVGRGSAYYLRDQPDALHVFIYAPFEEKVRRLQSEGKTQEEALELAESVDRDRAAFIMENFGVKFPTRTFFHVMVNSTIGEDAAVQIILNSLAALGEPKPS
ncbi:MAG TPA: cytidylate kinase-like family protein [Bryobacteraceae bacterium]|jgi:cytidylate kinase